MVGAFFDSRDDVLAVGGQEFSSGSPSRDRHREHDGQAHEEAQDHRDERELDQAYALVRTAYRVLPDRLTYFPLAYHARKHHQCLEKMKQRQEKSFAYRVPHTAGG